MCLEAQINISIIQTNQFRNSDVKVYFKDCTNPKFSVTAAVKAGAVEVSLKPVTVQWRKPV